MNKDLNKANFHCYEIKKAPKRFFKTYILFMTLLGFAGDSSIGNIIAVEHAIPRDVFD